MGKKTVRIGALAVLLLGISTSVHAGEPIQTPEELIPQLLAAAHKGDVEGFLSGLTAESRKALTELFANQAALSQAQEEFQKALDERFGKGAPVLADPPDDLKTAIGRLTAAEVISQQKKPDGSVELRVKTTVQTADAQTVSREETLVARAENGAWKLALGHPAHGGMAAERKAAAERITREVRDGKYEDRLAAMVALANAWAKKEGSAK